MSVSNGFLCSDSRLIARIFVEGRTSSRKLRRLTLLSLEWPAGESTSEEVLLVCFHRVKMMTIMIDQILCL